MYLDLTKKLGFRIREIRVGMQMINSSKLDTFGMVIAFFSMEDKKRRSHFFKKTILYTNINMDVILRMFFLTLSNIKIDFASYYIY